MNDLTDRLRLGAAGKHDDLSVMAEADDRIAELEAENSALKEQLAGRWSPIETAPKDDKFFIVFGADGFELCRFVNIGDGFWLTEQEKRVDFRRANYWQPLPPAPKGPDA